uniref:Uncharacterized protein n=1 Tax=Arundo donax TaxID=35708 RepID=A0A0A9ERC1_ARUDO
MSSRARSANATLQARDAFGRFRRTSPCPDSGDDGPIGASSSEEGGSSSAHAAS